MEPGETLSQAAYRETLEETGLKCKIGRVSGVFSDNLNGETIIFIIFEAYPLDELLEIKLEDKFDEYRWATEFEVVHMNKVRPRLLQFVKDRFCDDFLADRNIND